MKTSLIRFLSAVLIMALISGCSGNQNKNTKKMELKKNLIGRVDGKNVYRYIIKNKNGLTVELINYGGIITNLIVPDKDNNFEDVVLGYDSLQDYIDDTPYFGAIVGRYGNRIANGKFSIDGKTYQLATNDGKHHLHGGIKGFDKVVWDGKTFIEPSEAGVKLNYYSKDGEEGYPGNLKVTVVYTLNDDNELMIDYEAETDKPTVINLTHHSYFNLKGAGNGDILEHKIMINADKYNDVDQTLIPTGEFNEVKKTAMDFTTPNSIGSRIEEVEGGYDHNFVLNNFDGKMRLVAKVKEPESGRIMEVYTDQPGIQFYSGNFLDGSNIGKGGKVYNKHYGFCLETQHFPDSPNHSNFPSVVLRPGEKYETHTIYKFLSQ